MSMDSNTLLNTIVKETAAKVIDNLDANAKKEILTEAVARILENMRIGWDVSNIFREEALRFAKEYIKQPDIQQKMKQNNLKSECKEWVGEDD